MSLTVNGTLIPENKAKALTVNGANITDVWANGVSVWKQNLFSAQWSGSSGTFNTSGNLARLYSDATYNGIWATAYTNGTFSNTTSQTRATHIYMEQFQFGAASGYTNGIRVKQIAHTPSVGAAIRFNIGGAWGGSDSTVNICFKGCNVVTLQRSGASIRLHKQFGTLAPTIGNWITLT